MGPNWSFQRGGGIQTKKPSVGGVWIFSGTTQYNFLDIYSHFFSVQSKTKQAPNLYFFYKSTRNAWCGQEIAKAIPGKVIGNFKGGWFQKL